jgi:hypothetical protein
MSASYDVLSITPGSSRRIVPRAKAYFAAFALAALTSGTAATAAADPQNLIGGQRPSHSDGVTNADRLTDGILSNEGDEWLTDLTSRFSSARPSSSTTLETVAASPLRDGPGRQQRRLLSWRARWTVRLGRQLWRVGAEPARACVCAAPSWKPRFATFAFPPREATPSTAWVKSRSIPNARALAGGSASRARHSRGRFHRHQGSGVRLPGRNLRAGAPTRGIEVQYVLVLPVLSSLWMLTGISSTSIPSSIKSRPCAPWSRRWRPWWW